MVGEDVYEATLVEIGRITTTWAKFEHWVDQALWLLAGTEPRKGACLTLQMGSIHGKFRALTALMREVGRGDQAIKIANQIADDAARVVQIRTRFAHGPLDMGVNFETREFEVYLRRINLHGKTLHFETSALTKADLADAQKAVSDLFMRLIENYGLIVGENSKDMLAPPHRKG